MLALRFTLITLISIFLGGCMPKAQMNKPVPLLAVHFTVPAVSANCTALEDHWLCTYRPTTATHCTNSNSGIKLCTSPTAFDEKELHLWQHILANLKLEQQGTRTCLHLGGLYKAQCREDLDRVVTWDATSSTHRCREGTPDNPQAPALPPTTTPIIPGNTCPN